MRKVYWNKLAKSDYYENLDYLLAEWSEKEAQYFVDLVSEVEYILSRGNVDFRETDIDGVRCYTICKQITLFYKVIDKGNVELLRFWNNNKDYSKLDLPKNK